MDIPNIDLGLSSMLLTEMGAIAELQSKGKYGESSQELAERAQELAHRVQSLAGIAQTIAALNHAGVTSIDRSVVDEVLSRAKLEGLLS
jgi:hypothetical protein